MADFYEGSTVSYKYKGLDKIEYINSGIFLILCQMIQKYLKN